MNDVLLKDYRPECLLKVAAHVPERARFPVIDAHNHLFGDLPAEKLIEVMDAVGVRDVGERDRQHDPAVGEQHLQHRPPWAGSLHGALRAAIPGPVRRADDGRFRPVGRSGAAEGRRFRQAVHRTVWRPTWPAGARGLKVTKELGLFFRDRTGAMLRVDDERLGADLGAGGRIGRARA